jgi:hypothetical protein
VRFSAQSISFGTGSYIILFTDGMDNVSAQLARNDKRGNYANTAEYAKAIQKRINTIFDKKLLGGLFTQKSKRMNTFEIYLLGLRGEDLEKSKYTPEDLVNSLRPLAGSYNSVSHEPIVSDKMSEIFDDFSRNFTSSGYRFHVPTGYAENGYRIKMELTSDPDVDLNPSGPVPDPETFPYSFEADFVKEKVSFLKKEKYILKNIIKSDGLTFDGTTLEEVPGTSEKATTIEFTISNLRFNNDPVSVKNERQLFNDGAWRVNSEYKKAIGQNKNAYVLFVLDRSSSLNDEDKKASEDMVIKIINLIGGI